ncbi:hypothetical protein AB0D87_50410, partial [Streptomyces sp. NPDC048342]
HAPEGTAVVHVRTGEIRRFLEATGDLVPAGLEPPLARAARPERRTRARRRHRVPRRHSATSALPDPNDSQLV